MRKRTRFGVVIPPWRENRKGQPVTIELVLTGTIPSHKNRQRASFNYSWVVAQVKHFFKTQPAEIPKRIVLQFVIQLIKKLKPFIFKPKAIQEWEVEARQILTAQAASWIDSYASLGFCYPITLCSVSIKHYWADDRQRDNSNREQMIHDILVSAGIISDDNYKCLFLNTSEADCYKDEITDHITTINITAYRW